MSLNVYQNSMSKSATAEPIVGKHHQFSAADIQ